MNDIVSKLRKAASWVWNQKEKMFLGILLVVLLFRAYVVLINPPDVNALIAAVEKPAEKPKPAAKKPAPAAAPGAPAAAPKAAPITSDNVPLPAPKPVLERAEDFKPLVRQNPFTIYGVMAGTGSRGETEQEKIEIQLQRIVKWSDGSYRAEMITKVGGRPKRYAENEPFESYKVMEIDTVNNTVTVFSTAHGKAFTLSPVGS
ncbi:MAG: hypothetical protein SGI88_06140 [Candidatus Hydrogenedentes bacterium]|nr:hypothetical protein [Candidatus Hydrogenedentota bacterium]